MVRQTIGKAEGREIPETVFISYELLRGGELMLYSFSGQRNHNMIPAPILPKSTNLPDHNS